MDDKLKSLYNNLVKDNYDLPDYATFVNDMADETKSKKLHETLIKDNYDVPDYDTFTNDLGVKKKVSFVESIAKGENILEELGIKSEKPTTPPLPSELAEVPPTPDLTLQTPELGIERNIPNYLEQGANIPEPPKTAKTFGEWVTGAAGVFDKKLSSMFDALDYIQTSAGDALNQILLGKETAVGIKKLREEGNLSPAISGIRPFEAISDAIDYMASGAKPLPKTIGGGIVEGTMGVIPDILAATIAPEIATARVLQNMGIKTMSKFGMVIGSEQAVTGAQTAEGEPILRKIEAPILGAIEGYTTGWMFDNLGAISSKIGGKIANKLMPEVKTTGQAINKALTEHTGTSLTNAVFFGGYGNLEEYLRTGKISAETFATNAGMGLALGVRETGKLLYVKGINALISTPKDVINRTIKSKLTTEDLVKQAQDKIALIEKGDSPDRESDLLVAKMNANLAGLNAIVDEIQSDKRSVIQSVKESTLDTKVKNLLVDKINEIDADNDPKIQETKRYTEDIALLDDALDSIRENKSWDETRKEVESAPLKRKKEELKNKILEAYGKAEPQKEGGEEKKKELPLTKDDKAKIDKVLKAEEETKDAERIRTETESTGEQPQGVEQGKEGGLRVRDTSQDRVETVTGEEVIPPIAIGEKTPTTKAENKTLGIKTPNAFTIPITKEGQDVGMATIENLPEGWRIKWIDVEGTRTDKTTRGAGREAMRLLNAEAQKEGKVLISDLGDKNSADMVRVWDKLVESGEAEKLEDGSWRMKLQETIAPKADKTEILHEETMEPLAVAKKNVIDLLNKNQKAEWRGSLASDFFNKPPSDAQKELSDIIDSRNKRIRDKEFIDSKFKEEQSMFYHETGKKDFDSWYEIFKGKWNNQTNQLKEAVDLINKLKNKVKTEQLKTKEQEVKNKIANSLERLMGAIGGIKEFSGEQRKNVLTYLTDVIKGIAELTGLKGQQLWEKVKEYLKDNKVTIPDDVFEEAKGIYASKEATTTGTIPPKEPSKGESDTIVPPENNVPISDTRGTKKRIIGIRELEATMLRQPIKDAILKEGIDYVPRGMKMVEGEAKAFFDLYVEQEGGLDKIAEMVYNTKNDLKEDTRTFLNAYLADHYNTLYNKSTVQSEKDNYLRKATEAYLFGTEQGTLSGEKTNAQKIWGTILGKNPTMIAAIAQEHVNRKNKGFFESRQEEIEAGKKVLDAVFGSEEGKAKIEQEINDVFDKIGTARFGKEDMKKVDDFFNSLKIPTDQMYGGLLGIYAVAHNGAIEVIKRAVKGGMSLANAIQKGAEYIDQWYKDEHTKGKIDSPKWDKNGWVAKVGGQTEKIKKEVPKVEGALVEKKPTVKKEKKEKPAKVKKEKLPPTQEEIVDKLLEKMAKFATRKQLRNFIRDYVIEHNKLGIVSNERYKALLAKALGLDFVSDKQLSELTNNANTIGYASEKELDYLDSLNAYIKEVEADPKSDKLPAMQAELEAKGKAYDKAYFAGQKATAKIADQFAGEHYFLDTFTTLIQGGLLVPTSAMKNIYGMGIMAPMDIGKRLISNTIDMTMSAVGKRLDPIVNSIDPKTNPALYRIAHKYLPSEERTMSLLAQTKGYTKGFIKGGKQGLAQMVTGGLPSELVKYDIGRSLDPIKAAQRFIDRVRGEEKRKLTLMLSDLFEALPGGYISEANFRLLNVGDKPFRGGAEGGSLEETFQLREWLVENKIQRRVNAKEITQKEADAQLKQLKNSYDIRLKKFTELPDSEGKDIAEKVGEKAVYMNENLVTKILKYVDSLAAKGEKADANGVRNASHIGRIALKLAKGTIYPFVKAPTNLMSETMEYALPPFTFAASIYHVQQGNRRLAQDYFAKGVIGSMIGFGLITLLQKGILTPSGSDDDKTRGAEFASSGRGGDRLNVDAFRRFLMGGDPSWQEGDLSISTQGYGTISMIEKAYGSIWKDRLATETFNIADAMGSMTGAVIGSGFEQTFMQGMNTMLQAALGGEAEKQRWFVNTATTLTVPGYPNIIANVAKAYADDNEIKEIKDISKEEGRIKTTLTNNFKDRLFMGNQLPAKVSIWGDKVERVPDGKSPLYHILGVSKSKEYNQHTFGVKLYEMFLQEREKDPENAKNIFPSLPSGRTTVGWDDAKMTPDELEIYQMRVGKLRSIYAEHYVNSPEWEELPLEERTQQLTTLYSKAQKIIQAEMFDWNEYRGRKPQEWGILDRELAFPIPSRIRKVDEYKLTPLDMLQLNNIAMGYYADEIIPYLQGSQETLKKDRIDIDEKTGKSEYVLELEKAWRSALKDARDDMSDILEKSLKNK